MDSIKNLRCKCQTVFLIHRVAELCRIFRYMSNKIGKRWCNSADYSTLFLLLSIFYFTLSWWMGLGEAGRIHIVLEKYVKQSDEVNIYKKCLGKVTWDSSYLKLNFNVNPNLLKITNSRLRLDLELGLV